MRSCGQGSSREGAPLLLSAAAHRPVPATQYTPSPDTWPPAAGPPIHHFDLYRLTTPHDLLRLDLQSSLAHAVSLIEWAERLGEGAAPAEALAVQLAVVQAVGLGGRRELL